MILRRIALATAIALGLGGIAQAQAQAQAPARVPENRLLRVIPFADLQSLDPITTTVGMTQRHATMIYDVLLARDENQVPRPQMAEGWTVSPDNLVWRFTLRDGLMFHDGAPVTAEDVVASLRRWAQRDAHGRQIWAATASLAADDARSFTWTLTRPYGLMLFALSKPSGLMPAIMPARIAATDPATPITDTVGSGPFVFAREEWVPGSRVVYRRNERYVPRAEPASGAAGGKVVHVDRVEWLSIRDPQSASLALMNGEVDFVEAPGTDFLPMMRRGDMRVAVTDRLGSQGMMRMNHLHPPFNDVRARRALLYLINQDDFLSTMFGDPELYRICHAFFACGAPFETNAGHEATFGRDPARARALLREAGYNGEPIVILHPTDVQTMNTATLLLAEALRGIGVRVELQAMDFGAMAARRANRNPPGQGGWHIGLTFWPSLLISEPVGNVPMQATCERAWPGWPCDAEHQALIDAFPGTPGDAERKALVERIQISAYERVVPYVPFGQWFAPIAHSPRLSGVIGMPGTLILWNIQKAAR